MKVDDIYFEEYTNAVEDVLVTTDFYNPQRDVYEVPASSLKWLQEMHRLMTRKQILITGDTK